MKKKGIFKKSKRKFKMSFIQFNSRNKIINIRCMKTDKYNIEIDNYKY